jgi:hypothetical protein
MHICQRRNQGASGAVPHPKHNRFI